MSKLSPSEWFRVKIGSCVSHFNILLILLTETTSQDSVLKSQHLKRKQNWSGLEPSLSGYQPSALPLSQTGSTFVCLFFVLFFCFDVVFIEGVLETPSPSTWDKRRSGSGMTNQKKRETIAVPSKTRTSNFSISSACSECSSPSPIHLQLTVCGWQDVQITDALLQDVQITDALLQDVQITDALLQDVKITDSLLQDVQITDALLQDVQITDALLQDVKITDSLLQDVQITDALLQDVQITDTLLQDVKSTDALYIEVLFRICISAPDFCLSLAYSTIKSCILILTSTVAALTIYPCPLWINHKWIWINHNHRGNNCRH